jgi:hypothetical protein
MKNTIVLLLLGAVLAGGAGLWWSQSRSASQGDSLAGPAGSSSSATAKNENARLEAEPGGKRGALTAPKPAQSETPPGKPLPPEPILPSPAVVLSSDLDGGAAGAASPARDADQFELKWGEAKIPELKAAYQAYSELYQMNLDGRLPDKSQQLSGEGLERLAREVAWLKERAFGGG